MKKPLFFVFTFWLVYPCVPSFRDNLKLELLTPGVALDDTGCGGLSGSPLVFDEPVFGEAFGGDMQWERLSPNAANGDHWLKTFPNDPAAMAWWLSVNLYGLENHPWQFQSPFAKETGISAEQATGILKVAHRGEAVDSGNAFFPWIAAETDLCLGQRRAAIHELGRGIKSHRFNDYLPSFFADSIKFEQSRDLESTGTTFFLLQGREFDLFPSWRPIGFPVGAIGSLADQFRSDVPGTQLNEDFQLMSLIMRMGKLQRGAGTTLASRYMGACEEYTALSDSILPLMESVGTGRLNITDFTDPYIQPSSSRLVTVAPKLGHPEIAQMAFNEWDAGQHLDWSAYGAPHPEVRSDAADVMWCQRLERLILRSLPFCFMLLGLNSLFVRIRREPGYNSGSWSWVGPIGGGITFGLLKLADSLVSARSFSIEFGGLGNDPATWWGPGIAAAAPALTWFCAGFVLLGISYGLAMLAPGTGDAGADLLALARQTRGSRDWVVAARMMAWLSLWFLPVVFVFVAAWEASGPVYLPARPGVAAVHARDWVPEWSPLLVILFALAALSPWCLARKTKANHAAARVELRRLLVGYLMAATIAIAVLEIPRVAAQSTFDQEIGQIVERGG